MPHSYSARTLDGGVPDGRPLDGHDLESSEVQCAQENKAMLEAIYGATKSPAVYSANPEVIGRIRGEGAIQSPTP